MTEAGAANSIFSVWVAWVTTGKEAQRSQRYLRQRVNEETLSQPAAKSHFSTMLLAAVKWP